MSMTDEELDLLWRARVDELLSKHGDLADSESQLVRDFAAVLGLEDANMLASRLVGALDSSYRNGFLHGARFEYDRAHGSIPALPRKNEA